MNTVLLFLILVKLSLQLNKKETQKLFQWGKSKNVKFHPSIFLYSSDKEHPFPYFTTNTTISRDDLIIQIPYSVILTVDNIIKYSKSNKIKTIWINIGLIVHQSCSNTINGSREVAIVSAIEKALNNITFSKAIGSCEVDRIIKLSGLPYEWNGYEVSVKLDGFSELGTNIYEVDHE